jgi:hypothetical protein
MPKRRGSPLNKERSPETVIKRSSRIAENKVYIFLVKIRNKNPIRLRNDSAPCRRRIPLPKEHPQSTLTRPKLNTRGSERKAGHRARITINLPIDMLIKRIVLIFIGPNAVAQRNDEGKLSGIPSPTACCRG